VPWPCRWGAATWRGCTVEPALGTRSIPADEVEMANAIQVLAAQRYIFTHPGSGLDTFTARLRKNQRYPQA
jgi:hypothetical protein